MNLGISGPGPAVQELCFITFDLEEIKGPLLCFNIASKLIKSDAAEATGTALRDQPP